MIYKRVILKRGKEESVKRFHPWIFSGAIARADKMEEGDLVTVYTHDGALLGNGLLKGEALSKFLKRSVDMLK